MTKHSIDRYDWETKLNRISELSRDNKDIVFNNLGHMINLENLQDTYYQMDGSKAVGIDGITKVEYGIKLINNLEDLIKRIRRGSYKPKPARLVEIDKEDGGKRPLAISCFEDKLVQSILNKILTAIYEPLFLPCSFGFRQDRNCHDALRKLRNDVYRAKDGTVVEIDICKCFNKIPHTPLMEMLSRKISDRKFLRLIATILRTPTMVNGKTERNWAGCPQGSIASPTLANIYLHHVIDKWFAELKNIYFRGYSEMVRYADDMVFIFECPLEANNFYKVLPKRLNKYGLELNETKSQILRSGEEAARKAEAEGQRLGTYKFLGFVCYWGKSKSGRWRLKYKSRGDRFTKTLKAIKTYLTKHLNTSTTHMIIKRVIKSVKGWINYHAISDNERRVKSLLFKCRWLIYKWLNRKGGKKRKTWLQVYRRLNLIGFPITFKTISMFS